MSDGKTVDVILPQLAMSMADATIVSWRAAVGDHVDEGSDLVDIEMAKAETTVPAPCDGVLSEIIAAEDATVEVGDVIARITQAG